MPNLQHHEVTWDQVDNWRDNFKNKHGSNSVYEMYYPIRALIDIISNYNGLVAREDVFGTPNSIENYVLEFYDRISIQQENDLFAIIFFLKLVNGIQSFGDYIRIEDRFKSIGIDHILCENFCLELDSLYTSGISFQDVTSGEIFMSKFINQTGFSISTPDRIKIEDWIDSNVRVQYSMCMELKVHTVIVAAGDQSRKDIRVLPAFNHPNRCNPECP